MSSLLPFLAALVIVLTSGCSLLSPSPGPVIPTPPPTRVPVSFADLELVTNPASDVAPRVDADVQALLGTVSQQQLLAYVQRLESFGTRNTFSETQREDFGIGAARRWIHSEFLRVNSGGLQVAWDDFPVNINGLITNQRNVIATLPGISNHRGMIVLMAHYDSRTVDPMDGTSAAPGASDNASGVAILLELARLMSARSWNQTVVFAAFAAEEQGTFGSRHFVQDRLLDGRVFDAAIVSDIVGGRPGIPPAVRLFSPGPATSNSRQLARYVDYVAGLYLPSFRVDLIDAQDREGRYSDHREFINVGVPAVRLTEFEEDFSSQHSGADTSDKLDYSYIAEIARLNLAVAANMAGAPPPPQPPTVAPMDEPGAYVLTWLPDAQAAGYAVSFRPVESPDYLPFRFVSAADAGNVALTDFDPNLNYGVSLAAIGPDGLIGQFTEEIVVGPSP
ncbi:MAG: M20/M25/M40 family metallo-hydrolase [Candidatus Promineifilaceae bacterium]|nr:M20/M25/M40 family metallo-hydrolase [Candidatus Promineifilaceae bacterium]